MTDSQKRDLIALVWGHRLFRDSDIAAPEQAVCVENPGYAPEAGPGEAVTPGPDFTNAAVRYGDSLLCGAVRIDSRSSLWRESGAMTDPAFDPVLFHVVGQRDRVLVRDGREVRTLILTPAAEMEALYGQMLDEAVRGGTGCAGFFATLPGVQQEQILSRLTAERLRRKTAEVEAIRRSLGGCWDETAYVCYLRSLGMGGQKRSYEALARSVPLRCLVRCAGDVRQAEALLMGQSGYLNVASASDPKIRELQDIYLTLKKEYGLLRPVVSWAGAGVRPASLPPAMLSHAAALLARVPVLSGSLKAASERGMAALRDLFGSAETGISPAKTDLRIINFVIPLLTAMGRDTGDAQLQERALGLYEEVAPEANRYTRLWQEAFDLRSASDSQAVIQLCTEYCGRGGCAKCPVGTLRLVRLWKKLR